MTGVQTCALPISILVPQQAVTITANSATVWVVGADAKPTLRPVKLGGVQSGQWVVLEGLKAGEQVVVDGFQKMRPNAPVKPVPWQPGAPATTAAATAAVPASAASAR